MHEAMKEYGKPFKAADAIRVAEHVPELAEKLREQPSRVYSWLGRELFKHKLAKDGDYYLYPSQRNEALNGKPASASVAEGAATPSFENVVGFNRPR
jgi:hypothetical protein